MSLQRPKRCKDNPSATASFSANRSSEEISHLTASEPAPAFYQYSHSHVSSAAINIPCSGLHSGTLASSYQSSTGIYLFDVDCFNNVTVLDVVLYLLKSKSLCLCGHAVINSKVSKIISL